MTPYEILLSRIAGADAGGRRAGDECRQVQAICAQVGARRHADRPGDRRRPLPRSGMATAWWPRSPGSALVDDCPVYYPAAPREPRRRGRAARAPAPPPRPRADLTAALRSSCSIRRPSPASAGSSSSTTRPSRPARVIGPGGDAGVLRVRGTAFGLAVTVDCNGRCVVPRPLRGRQGSRRRGRAQHRLHRRPAARHHQLPQLRQPGEARGLLPVPRGVPGHRRRLPRLRHAGDRRQRVVLQREPDRRRRPHADGRHGRACCERIGDRVASHFQSPGDSGAPARHDDRRIWAARPTGPRCGDFVGGAPPAVDLAAERASAAIPGGGGRRPACSARRTTARRRPRGGAGRGGNGRALRRRCLRRPAST